MATLRGGKLTPAKVRELRRVFEKNLSAIAMGKTWISITKTGGVYYTNRKVEKRALFFEIAKGGRYLVVAIYEYPKGLIVHFFNPTEQRSFSAEERNEVLKQLKEIFADEES